MNEYLLTRLAELHSLCDVAFAVSFMYFVLMGVMKGACAAFGDDGDEPEDVGRVVKFMRRHIAVPAVAIVLSLAGLVALPDRKDVLIILGKGVADSAIEAISSRGD